MKEIEYPLFVPCDCFYDPDVDCAEVDQFGFVDMRQAFLTGTVDGSVAPDDTSFNGIDDPEAILPAARDEFEAIRQAHYAASYRPKSKSAPAAPAASSTEGEGASSAAAE